MTAMTYDPDADAAYLALGRGKVAETREIAADLIADYDAEGRIIGLEILAASRTLAPGAWSRAPRPGAVPPQSDAAE